MSQLDPSNPLPSLDIRSRIPRLRAAFEPGGIDALVVTRMVNIRYLTGFTGSAATVLVTPDVTLFVTDGRYAEQSAEQLDVAAVDARIEIAASGAETGPLLQDAVRDGGVGRLGLEAHGVTWLQQRQYAEWFEGVELVPTENLVEELRVVKEAGEVARIRRACAIADDAFVALLPMLEQGVSECDFALALEFAMRERGASGNSFDPIVASGPNGALPHARPTNRRVGRGELVVCDFGCVVDGYCSDMTRTVSVGDPGPEATRLWETVLASQEAGRAALRSGVETNAVDAAARDVIDAAGWGERFSHGTGHGVGLEIHEAPRVAKTGGATLAPGYIVTVEPGVYLPGVGGVRIEDTLVVTDDGAEALTTTPKELVL